MFFEKISPEAAGVPPQAICGFFRHLDALSFDMHSVIMIRHGKLLLETYYEPYTADALHRMYSVTKSYVGLAIGCLASEGKIGLDDFITSYFPEYPTPYEYIKKTTIRNMLMMRTPHEKTTYKADLSGNWVKSFFTTEPSHMPGTVFAYDTSSSHVLGALVEKITGMTFLDYLREKFLDEIGFSKEAYCLKDPDGVSVGGSGLMAKPMDLAKTAYLVMSGGSYNGKQLIDRDFLSEAVSYLSSNSVRGNFTEEKQGYGMQFWRTRDNGFMFYGLGGQLALCLPDKDFILVTTADAMGYHGGAQEIIGAFRREIYSCLDKQSCGSGEELTELLKNRRIKPVPGIAESFKAKYIFDKNVMGISELCVISDENGGSIEYENNTGRHVLRFRTGGFHEGKFPYYDCECITSGAWRENVLTIKSRLTGEMVGAVTMELCFTENGVTISSRKTEGTYFNEFNGIVQGRKTE